MRTLILLLALPLGIFEDHADIGANPKSGGAEFANREYRVTGGGANMWGSADAFHFVWKRVSGDVTLSADVRFNGVGVDPHRKAALLVREDLDPGSVYADIAVHGDGLTSLQFRRTKDGNTEEMRSEQKAPTSIRLEKRGDQITVYADGKATGPLTLKLKEPFYVGLGVCSHNAEVLETAVFSNVRFE